MVESGLIAVEQLPADRHPAAVYIASLAPASRRDMVWALDVAARLLTAGRSDRMGIARWQLRRPHLEALRAKLADSHAGDGEEGLVRGPRRLSTHA